MIRFRHCFVCSSSLSFTGVATNFLFFAAMASVVSGLTFFVTTARKCCTDRCATVRVPAWMAAISFSRRSWFCCSSVRSRSNWVTAVFSASSCVRRTSTFCCSQVRSARSSPMASLANTSSVSPSCHSSNLHMPLEVIALRRHCV